MVLIGVSSSTWLRDTGDPVADGGFRDIAGRDRAVELARFAGLAQDDEALAFELAAVAHGGLAAFLVLGLERGAVALELALLASVARSALCCGKRKLRA